MQDLLAGASIHRLLTWGGVATHTDPKTYIETVLEAVGFPRSFDRAPRSKRSDRRW